MRLWRGLGVRIRMTLVNLIRNLGLLGFVRAMRSSWFSIENYLLALVFPNGRFIRSNGAEIFVDFNDLNSRWYRDSNLSLYQEHEAFVKLLEAKSPCVIIDIGAHWGIFPAMLDADEKFSKKIKRVICIEPDPKNIPRLKKTASRIKNFPVSIVEAAIGARDSEISAYRGGGDCLQTYASSEQGLSSTKVAVRTLESILSSLKINVDDVTHIKIDIDGYEPAFFIGNRNLLQRVQPLVLAEYWAKGLLNNKEYPISDYWKFLIEQYDIYICNYPDGDYTLLVGSDFIRLNSLTMTSVRNLLLAPKATMLGKDLKLKTRLGA